MVRFSIAFLIGVCLFQAMPQIPSIVWSGVAVFFILPAAFYPPIRLFTFVLLGFLWSWGAAMFFLSNQLDSSFASSITQLQGRIIEVPFQDNDRFSKFLFSTTAYRTNQHDWQPLNFTTQLYWNKTAPVLKSGDQWQLHVTLKPPVGYSNPGGFDREKWLFIRRIQATGSVMQALENKLIQQSTSVSVSSIRQYISDLINSESGYQHAALLKALSVGIKHSISQSDWTLLQDTGTAHLIAISGLHIGLASGIAVMCVSFAWRMTMYSTRIPALKIAAIGGIVTSILYAALAGLAIPTFRAMIMLIALYLSLLLNFRINPWNILATALFLVLIITPMSVLSSGFWLSFLAVAWILYFLENRRGRGQKVRVAIKLQFVLAAGLLPVMLTDFGQLALIAPVTNLLAVPFASIFIVPSIMLAMISLIFSEPLFLKILYFSDFQLMLLLKWINLTSGFFLASYPASISRELLLILIPGLLLIISPLGQITRVAGFFALMSLPFWKAERPDAGELWMTVLDVGQGLSIVVQTQNHVLIYDAGPGFPSGYNTGDSVVLPFLAKSGIHRIDKLMISHSDTDHAGGAEAIFRAIHVDNVLAGEPEKIRWAKSRHCHKNASWRWDQVAFRILSPTTQQPGNNGSCVLQITDLSGSSVLVPGDIEWPIEHYLVNKFSDNLDSDVLVAPHHGSKTSSRFTFLQHISPETVLIPAGYKNRYGFPHPLVVDKYRQLETDIFVTGIDGALFVKSRKNAAGYSIDTYRKTHKRYWQTVLK